MVCIIKSHAINLNFMILWNNYGKVNWSALAALNQVNYKLSNTMGKSSKQNARIGVGKLKLTK